MKNSIKFVYKYLVVIGISICINNLLLNSAEAISIYPYRTEITISPGETYRGEFIVINNNDEPIRAVIYPDKSIMADIEGEDSSKWLRVSIDKIIIPPKEKRNVKYKFTVSKKAKGEYAPTIVFREEPVGRKAQAYTQIRMPIYIIIKGTEIFKGEIETIKVLSANPIKISILVRNNGNIHVRPTGRLTIKRTGNKLTDISLENPRAVETVAIVFDVNQKGGPIFGGSVGDIGMAGSESLGAGNNYIAELELEYSPGIILNKKVSFEVSSKNEVKMLE